VKYESKRFYQVLLVIIVGGFLGVGSAMFAVELVYEKEIGARGAWGPEAGTDLLSSNRWARTATALSGTWLPSGEGVTEWTALHDSQGKRLDGNCTYYVSTSEALESSWTMALYNNDHQLPLTDGRPGFVASDDLEVDSRGKVQLQAGGLDQGGAWLPSESGPFSLTLRTYAEAAGKTGTSPAFAIDRGECK
jgi:hypothetical protein